MFLPTDPFNEEVYYCDSLSMDDILAVVWRHTNIFNEKTAQSFSKWCGSKKIYLMNATIKRKANEHQQKTSVRTLFVLKKNSFSVRSIVFIFAGL